MLTAGVDLVDLPRIATLHRTWGERLLDRLCGAQERAALQELPVALRPRGLALTFGLKESVIKSVGGIPAGGLFTDTDASGMLRALDSSGSPMAGPVVVRGATAQHLPGDPDQRRCRGGAVLVEDQALLTWVLIEETP